MGTSNRYEFEAYSPQRVFPGLGSPRENVDTTWILKLPGVGSSLQTLSAKRGYRSTTTQG